MYHKYVLCVSTIYFKQKSLPTYNLKNRPVQCKACPEKDPSEDPLLNNNNKNVVYGFM